MTKYILHGGKTTIDNENNKNFFKEIVTGLRNPHILLVYFARPESEWEELSNEDTQKLMSCDKNITREIADRNMEKCIEQIKHSDAIYMRGGTTQDLLDNLKKIKNLGKLFEGKTVAGSSAGAYVLSKYYWGNSVAEIREGLGILKIKSIAHFSEELQQGYDKLKSYKEDYPLYALPDTEFVVL
jgi:peptidase E